MYVFEIISDFDNELIKFWVNFKYRVKCKILIKKYLMGISIIW